MSCKRGYKQAERSPEHAACAGKVLDLLADHVYASVIRCIQLQCHVRHGTAVNLAGYSQYGGRLAGARWPIQQQVWEAVLAGELLDCSARDTDNLILDVLIAACCSLECNRQSNSWAKLQTC